MHGVFYFTPPLRKFVIIKQRAFKPKHEFREAFNVSDFGRDMATFNFWVLNFLDKALSQFEPWNSKIPEVLKKKPTPI